MWREGIALDIEELSWSLVATTDPTAARQLHELDWALAQMPEEQRQVILLVGLECNGIWGPQKSLTCRSGQSVRARPGCLRKLMGMGEKATGVSSGFNKPLPKETVIPPRALAA